MRDGVADRFMAWLQRPRNLLVMVALLFGLLGFQTALLWGQITSNAEQNDRLDLTDLAAAERSYDARLANCKRDNGQDEGLVALLRQFRVPTDYAPADCERFAATGKIEYARITPRLDQIPRRPTQPGTPGARGFSGVPGRPGLQGPQGAAGPAGVKGETGPQGPQGEKGDPGPQGDRGPAAEKGERGPIGPQGEKGDTGPVGPVGPEGPAGPPGPQGEPGTCIGMCPLLP